MLLFHNLLLEYMSLFVSTNPTYHPLIKQHICHLGVDFFVFGPITKSKIVLKISFNCPKICGISNEVDQSFLSKKEKLCFFSIFYPLLFWRFLDFIYHDTHFYCLRTSYFQDIWVLRWYKSVKIIL